MKCRPQLRQLGLDGVSLYSRQGSYRTQLVVTWANDPVVMAAGDIACAAGRAVAASACRQQYTSDLLVAEPELAAVLQLGDAQYEDALYWTFSERDTTTRRGGGAQVDHAPVPGNTSITSRERPDTSILRRAAGLAGQGLLTATTSGRGT